MGQGMQKNIAIACGIGDLFIFLTKMKDFFKDNNEYDSVKFWTWLHTPALAKEFVGLSKEPVTIFSIDEINEFLLSTLPEEEKGRVAERLLTQHSGGVGVDKYMGFLKSFFPNMETWIHLPVYDKYKSEFPYKLDVKPHIQERPYVVVHPISSVVKTEKPERHWSDRRWKFLIGMIPKYTNVDVYVIGTNQDKKRLPDLLTLKNDNVKFLLGKTSLEETTAYIYGAKAVVGINSWTTELSAWANIPTYVQWFVQHQLIDFHYPKGYEKTGHIFIEKNYGDNPEEIRYYHPTATQAWNGVREILDYAKCPI